LLLRNKHWVSLAVRRRKAREADAAAVAKRLRVVSSTKQLHLLDDGGWWEVTLAPVTIMRRDKRFGGGAFEVPATDVVLDAKLSNLSREVLYGRPGVRAVVKRQLSRKEMRDLKLR
jgi:hypothetical protein